MACSKMLLCVGISRQSSKIGSSFKVFRKNFSLGNSIYKKSESCCPPECPGPTPNLPMNCRELKPPIICPDCRVAIVVGGSNNGFGYVAADQLLMNGAKKVVIADFDMDVGDFAAERLCRKFGKHRARFVSCNIKSSCQIEAVLRAYADAGEPISIMFNDLDAIQLAPESSYGCCPPETPKVSTVQDYTTTGFRNMSKSSRVDTSIIFNCASILGIMGWPANPEPVYCQREHVIHVTSELANAFPFSESRVRVVAVCPSKRNMENIGLPTLPSREDIIDFQTCGYLVCTPDISKDATRVGEALVHLMAVADSGTSWLMEPPWSLRERPRLLDMSQKATGPTEKEKQEVVRRGLQIVPDGTHGNGGLDIPFAKTAGSFKLPILKGVSKLTGIAQ